MRWESFTRTGWESFTRRLGILHKDWSGILHKEVGNPSQGGRESFTRRSGILHKEVGNPSQGGRESFREGRSAHPSHARSAILQQGGRESYHNEVSCLNVFTRRLGILHKDWSGILQQGGTGILQTRRFGNPNHKEDGYYYSLYNS